eukprot:gnl/MRDRNA2_/MRDRNA2_332582_c0_seq1.p1 gnl/MRDRNA2_/MRDRNA2_332582_c0~~gnl/MRDRNA2_/MRDRNA2_332582_c0_seq1.p1  ORF type:complete len:106 (+),score=21.80 gnl/MRDRNA2_/MRDRNA2_332582_c0_seq1:113-430(+)
MGSAQTQEKPKSFLEEHNEALAETMNAGRRNSRQSFELYADKARPKKDVKAANADTSSSFRCCCKQVDGEAQLVMQPVEEMPVMQHMDRPDDASEFPVGKVQKSQ